MCLAAIYWARLDRVYFANTRADAARIGFDDAWIYAELPKAPEVRSLPMAHLPLPEAEALFREWETKADKVPYLMGAGNDGQRRTRLRGSRRQPATRSRG